MKWNTVEVLFQRENISQFQLGLQQAKGVKLLKTETLESPNYLFATIAIDEKAPAQKLQFRFTRDQEIFTFEYPILARNTQLRAQGVDARDVIYLIFPDRFANGDPGNDQVPGMLQGLERERSEGRHGGDLKGIQDHLDYLKSMGVSAIWLNPELENDQLEASYHGYAVTDHYRVDRRFGTNETLRNLISACHKQGIKVIRDVVLNHIGDNHYWMKDLPSKDWVNQWPKYTQTSYRAPVLVDPYASDYDKKQFQEGWFDKRMPDLNQKNPHVANYLIQQAIWWVEYAGFDDFRIDTYTYSDQTFCSSWCKALREEYPNLSMFGEIWENAVPVQGYFADNQPLFGDKFDSNLPGVVDFQLCFAIQEALTKPTTWTEGASKIYYVLAQDKMYQNPYKNLVMLDNHDMARFYTHIGENPDKFKTGMAFLLTTRGIPQLYYGTEILGTGDGKTDWGSFRKDFPGGWPGDPANKFQASGRTPAEQDAFLFTQKLIQYRNQTPALQTGKLMQFATRDQEPEKGIYVYFRFDEAKTIMIVLNFSDQVKMLDTTRFKEKMTGFSTAKNVITDQWISSLDKLTIPAYSPLVLELN
ncbi:MAG: cyclomaltodextrinase C-terminal domain-containing protein [Chitinophagales bacterium]|nr:cyclomaltodextrinase C-terminal domain-containing protein [Chitinophagales bacterium]